MQPLHTFGADRKSVSPCSSRPKPATDPFVPPRLRYVPAGGRVLVGSAGRSLPRCLIPRFDGAILSQEWKEALWARFVTEAPRPTPIESLCLGNQTDPGQEDKIPGCLWKRSCGPCEWARSGVNCLLSSGIGTRSPNAPDCGSRPMYLSYCRFRGQQVKLA